MQSYDFEQCAFSHAHGIEPKIDFDFEAIDRGDPLTAELERPESPYTPPEIIVRMLDVLLDGSAAPLSIGIKVIALASIIRHPALEGKTPVELAAKYGLTKQAIYRCTSAFRDKLGLKAGWQWSEEARRIIAESARRVHQRRKETSPASQTGEVQGNLETERMSP